MEGDATDSLGFFYERCLSHFQVLSVILNRMGLVVKSTEGDRLFADFLHGSASYASFLDVVPRGFSVLMATPSPYSVFSN